MSKSYVLETLRLLKRQKKTHYLSDGYEVMLEQQTVRTLFDNFKLNQSLEEIILNVRILASFVLGKRNLVFNLKPFKLREHSRQIKSKRLFSQSQLES